MPFQLGAESLTHLKKLASNVTGGGAGSGLDGAGGCTILSNRMIYQFYKWFILIEAIRSM